MEPKIVPTRAGGFFNRSVIWGVLLLGIILAASAYIVSKYRQPGAMTPIEAQSMQMELPAPAGTLPVELATVERGRVESVVRASGQAVGYVEQDVVARVTGMLVWMPFYVGDRVRRGQVLARLDTSQSAPQVANQRAMLDIAVQGVGVARKEYEQTLAAIKEAHAEVGMKTGAVAGARAELMAAQAERATAQAELEAAQSMGPDAEAQLQAAQADQRYWQEEIEREGRLLKAGAVTTEEYGRERAEAENAGARVRQVEARIVQVQAQGRAAQANTRKAEAMVGAATAKVQEAEAELNSHSAHVNSTQAMAASARQKIVQAQAGVEQARAALAGAAAMQGYSEIKAETDGVVTQRVISPGVLVNPGQAILRITQVAPIRLQASVTEADLQKIRVGSPVRVTRRDTGKAVSARITSISPAVDAASRMALVEAVLPNSPLRFMPGQFVTLEIGIGASDNSLRIPTRALRYHTAPTGDVISTQTTPTVWIADPVDGLEGQYTVREVAVRIGLSDGDHTEVRDGLKAGERVVLSGLENLKNGDTVSQVADLDAPTARAATIGTHGDAADRSQHQQASRSGYGVTRPRLHYTCIMHPEIDLDHPGNCPKCGMTLVLKRNGGTR
jgi:RND family efflux transporter MFP subunit